MIDFIYYYEPEFTNLGTVKIEPKIIKKLENDNDIEICDYFEWIKEDTK